MFAFCPQTKALSCGIVNSGDKTDGSMKIEAKRFSQKVTADLQYVNGNPSERRYDSCYYEIGPNA